LGRIISYQNGLPEGDTFVYNEKGYLVQEGSYHQGLETGEWKFYGDDGKLKFFGSYKEGKPQGVWYKVKKGKQEVYKQY
jgi:antitoxin component YwqK of YwqJK toxin-antitoxin module